MNMPSPTSDGDQMSASSGTFSCFLCEAEGFTAVEMEFHIRGAHSDDPNAVSVSKYSCIFCDYDTACESDLDYHTKTEHSVECTCPVSKKGTPGEVVSTSDSEQQELKPRLCKRDTKEEENGVEAESSYNVCDERIVMSESLETSLRLTDCPEENEFHDDLAHHQISPHEILISDEEEINDMDTDEKVASASAVESDNESNLSVILSSVKTGILNPKPAASSSDTAMKLDQQCYGGARPKVKTTAAAGSASENMIDRQSSSSSVDAKYSVTASHRASADNLADYSMDKTFHCPLCSFKTQSEGEISHHVNQEHMMEEEEETRTEQAAGLLVFYSCPFCANCFDTPNELSRHINSVHPDGEVGGGTSSQEWSEVPGSTMAMNSQQSEPLECPVCGLVFADGEELSLSTHVSDHFASSVSHQVQENPETDRQMALKIQREETKRLQEEENKFHQIQAQYGMDSSTTANQQFEKDLEQAVFKGKMTTSEFHEKKIIQKQSTRSGVDDGSTQVPGILERLRQYYDSKNCPRTVTQAHFSNSTHHYSSSYGDKGWGCGYRNFQMMLSCLMNDPTYLRVLFNGKAKIPSIQKLQQLIETAWEKGFDRQGCQQLGGTLVNTRKWIGATEIVATLSSLKIGCELLDFVTPSGPDNTHPALMQWVRQYFTSSNPFKPPLYLQHQGHSRTIVGVEELRNGDTNLLLFDPGVPRPRMVQFHDNINYNLLQSVRKTMNAFRAKQYQIVAVTGVLDEKEYERNKMIRSKRMS